MPLKAGDLVKHYRMLEKVGEGGLGVVYRAHDTKLDRDVALKFLVNAAMADSEHRARLRQEARSLAALNHPGILTIHDIDEADGVPFLVLEWIAGRPLSHPALVGPLPIREFLRIATAIADALGAAHDRGIIHRDVKPSNVLLTDDGHLKLVDFGLAKLHHPDRDVTRTRGLVGTVAYMSPEQANSAELGPPTDVFSFGVLAYELLAGRKPFQGEGPGAVLAAIIRGHPAPLSDFRRDIPGRLKAIVESLSGDGCLGSLPERGRPCARAPPRPAGPGFGGHG